MGSVQRRILFMYVSWSVPIDGGYFSWLQAESVSQNTRRTAKCTSIASAFWPRANWNESKNLHPSLTPCFVDMFALALSILRAARMRTAEKALRTGMLAMQAINLRSVFEREKEKKKRRSVRLRYWVVVVGKVRSHSCQGPAGFENEKDLGKLLSSAWWRE